MNKHKVKRDKVKHTLDFNKNYSYLFIILLSICSFVLADPPNPPLEGSYHTHIYRSLFAEYGFDKMAIHKKLDAIWNQLFYGDSITQRVYYPAGSNNNGDLAYIQDIGNDDVRSEGLSYGMMIAVQMDKQLEFNALWNWSKTYMYHDDPDHPCFRYFAWSLDTDGTIIDDNPASDGEEYFAMALYFASGRWGNGKGIYHYKNEADNIVDAMKNRQDITGQIYQGRSSRSVTITSLFNTIEKQVRFTPDKSNFPVNGDHTDPSYHLPAFYELFALWGPDADKSFWKEAATISRTFFDRTTNDTTGLMPDYANFDGSPKAASWNPDTQYFRFDAWRTAMNWSIDYSWWAADKNEKILSNRIQTFFINEGISTYAEQYQLNGIPLGRNHPAGLVAMNAVASLASTHEQAGLFVKELWKLDIPSGRYRYYNGMLYFFAMLACSGNYRIYEPAM